MSLPRPRTAARVVGSAPALLLGLSACILDNPAYDGEGEATSTGDALMTASAGASADVAGDTNFTSGGTGTASAGTTEGTATTEGADSSTTAGPSCADLTCDPNASCVNGPDGPTCSCDAGFVGDGLTCADIDECVEPALCTVGLCVNLEGGFTCSFPATCAELKAAAPEAADGPYTLFIAGDMAKPWTAYCHDMGGSPREFLTLPRQGEGANVSRYTIVNPFPGYMGERRMKYQRVRIKPATLRVDIGDTTFTTTSGTATFNGGMVHSVDYGVAMTCIGGATTANIDLRDTPFDAQADQWCTGGYMPSGKTESPAAQVYVQSGGGDCGWRAPATGGCPDGPFNNNGGGDRLQLVYVGG
ncbi:MAG: GON domain-containing protein [Nannocystaceae bacterium]